MHYLIYICVYIYNNYILHCTYSDNNISTPHSRSKIKCQQLTRFIKLAVLHLGQMHLSVQFLFKEKSNKIVLIFFLTYNMDLEHLFHYIYIANEI